MSGKDLFEPDLYAGGLFAGGLFRGLGVDSQFLANGETWEAEDRPTRWSDTRSTTWEIDRPTTWSYQHDHA